MNTLTYEVSTLLYSLGINEENLNWGTRIILLVCVFALAYVITKIFHYFIIPVVHKITSKTKATWDDYLFNGQMLSAICRLIPPIVVFLLLPFVIGDMPDALKVGLDFCKVYLVIVTLRLVNAFLNSLYEISNEHEKFRHRPLKGVYQMINLISIAVGFILIISILMNQKTNTVLAGLGASAAVLMLIFKDSILGLVAGVQLSVNDMLRPGDWITMEKYGANGFVIEVSLTTVKVQNFDKTITTIPPYALVSDSFQNWRGMRECGGRRIKRSINIDMNTVRFCTAEELKLFKKRGWVENTDIERDDIVNVEVFCNYLRQYIKKHLLVKKDLMMMVRQLQPSPDGLPIEFYCFANTTEWIKYEAVQDDLLSHVIAILPKFGLRPFQNPSGVDIMSLKNE